MLSYDVGRTKLLVVATCVKTRTKIEVKVGRKT